MLIKLHLNLVISMQNDSIFLSEVKDFFHEIHPTLSAKVMEIYNAKDFFVDEKKDGSPVTQLSLIHI